MILFDRLAMAAIFTAVALPALANIVVATPEPASMALYAIGAAGVMAVRAIRRRR